MTALDPTTMTLLLENSIEIVSIFLKNVDEFDDIYRHHFNDLTTLKTLQQYYKNVNCTRWHKRSFPHIDNFLASNTVEALQFVYYYVHVNYSIVWKAHSMYIGIVICQYINTYINKYIQLYQ